MLQRTAARPQNLSAHCLSGGDVCRQPLHIGTAVAMVALQLLSAIATD